MNIWNILREGRRNKVLTGIDFLGLPILGGLLLLLLSFIYVMIAGVLRNKKEK
ncbi:hypothetical protein ACIQZG_13595 [Lysinibacillus sp. NPDC096418]|uniref:hypothetical protein n=1 Tax=Lysinibacillus sp. NPDC096418 TaxID=3364138 RepID=UPI00382F81F7